MPLQLNTIYHGNCLEILKTLPSESIDLCVTSPPYYALRDYGVEGQIGLEKSPQEYISKLIEIFAEVKRILKKTGSLWVNIADSYVFNGGSMNCEKATVGAAKAGVQRGIGRITDIENLGIKKKSLIGIPERFAIAMTDQLQFIRRNTIIWHKPNCMPSSAKDRFTNDFEYFYFFTKSQKYYFETQYEPLQEESIKRANRGNDIKQKSGYSGLNYNSRENILKNIREGTTQGRIKRCVWQVTLKPFSEAHFATYPEDLIETPIKACCPLDGIVLDCFMGAGTTGLVALKQRKKFIGIEINEDYIEIANKRLEPYLYQTKLAI